MNLTATLPYLNPVYTHQPIAFIVKRFLKKHGVKTNLNLLHQKLSEHPYFPSLLSISEVLTTMHVPNQAYKIDLETLKENFEAPILIYLKIDQGLFCILDEIKAGSFKVTTEKGERKWFAEAEFIKVWEGVLLDVELTDRVGYSVKGQDNVYPDYLKYFLITCWALITFYILQKLNSNLTISSSILLALNISGLILTWLMCINPLKGWTKL
ncbi:MAG TPA: cysteine peptidase family C39 domain-containing protein [Sphingobacteriaceae bacterium]|nr:cysteine peptidase family C39 domain-containing protein [Sphingobacteriaceae bacterium]